MVSQLRPGGHNFVVIQYNARPKPFCLFDHLRERGEEAEELLASVCGGTRLAAVDVPDDGRARVAPSIAWGRVSFVCPGALSFVGGYRICAPR